ncbi:hypothetical protein BVG16_27430 [Paenibacillus selenitireducens]|uniref:DUF4375 domain-containing protein n=1 Tax=Paenibacillus selenitireducens TaxID=1324314 RepID=A0A1T2X1S6_9BACL|nr:hypothetical protein [Paenibacillus selenitireducens]OPA73812.1 hypothetical protein BVG16_27430 [Paenibacillus selenitireducens]
MLTKLKQEDLLKENLSWLCIEPMLLSVRGKNLEIKANLYAQLNEGQRSLYMFYAFHNHVHSIFDFYWYAAFYMNEIKAWDGVKRGVLFFKDQELLNVLEHLEILIEQKNKGTNGIWNEITISDLEQDPSLHESVSKLFNDYQSMAPMTINQMNLYIRKNQAEFLEIEV